MVNGQSQSEWCWAIKVKLLILWASFRLANHGKWQIPQCHSQCFRLLLIVGERWQLPESTFWRLKRNGLFNDQNISLNSVLVSILNVFQEYVHVLPALIVFEELVPAGCPEPRLRQTFLADIFSAQGIQMRLYYTLLTRASDNIDYCTKPSCTWTFSLRKFMLIGRNCKYWTRAYLPWC